MTFCFLRFKSLTGIYFVRIFRNRNDFDATAFTDSFKTAILLEALIVEEEGGAFHEEGGMYFFPLSLWSTGQSSISEELQK